MALPVLLIVAAITLAAMAAVSNSAPASPSAEEIPSSATVIAPPAPPFDPGTAGFSLQVKDEVLPYTVMAVFVMPASELRIEAVFGQRDSRFSASARAGQLRRLEHDLWTWQAPEEPGLYELTVEDTVHGDTLRLNVFVLRPYKREPVLAGYRIGQYEPRPLRNLAAYEVPIGMVEVTEELMQAQVSPHFTLGQFVSRQESDFPKFVVLRERLILKLEMLLEQFNRQGFRTDSLVVMSGFRTPDYNASIGNRTTYSRHSYGDAADIFIDNDADGRLDDLDGDGDSDLADAQILAQTVDRLAEETWYQPFIGGLGVYGPAPHRGPFIHVDTRGYRARW